MMLVAPRQPSQRTRKGDRFLMCSSSQKLILKIFLATPALCSNRNRFRNDDKVTHSLKDWLAGPDVDAILADFSEQASYSYSNPSQSDVEEFRSFSWVRPSSSMLSGHN
jgi:hypothetical protein